MEVILHEKVRNVGAIGQKVRVKPGYARNFLFPKRKAVPATAANLAKFEAQRAEFEKRAAEALKLAEEKAAEIAAIGALQIAAKVAEEGKLYGSVGIGEILVALNKANIAINRSDIKLPTGPIRHIGEYEVHLYFHTDVHAVIKVVVVAE